MGPRPRIILKWAETADGFIAREDLSSRWISSDASRELVHRWRGEVDAILVGTRTALHDNPRLTARTVDARNPIRVVLDRDLVVPHTHHLFDDEAETIVFNASQSRAERRTTWIAIPWNDDRLEVMSRALHARGLGSLLVEGGSATLQAFIHRRLWDEARRFITPVTFGSGVAAPLPPGYLDTTHSIGSDRLEIRRRTA